MIQAYHQVMSDYAARYQNRNTTHRQKELKEVYNRILSMNRCSPYYKLDVSGHKQSFALRLKDASMALSATLKDLSDTIQTTSTVDTADSSAPETILASLAKGHAGEFRTPLQIEVHSLATSQCNTGFYVPSEEDGPNPGEYRFTIQVEDDAYEFSYRVSQVSKNRDLMKKLTAFINKSGIGIHAELEDHPSEPLSRIVISSLDTGVAPGEELLFTIRDKGDASFGLVRYFGLDHVLQQPANATFTVNGEPHASMQNSFVFNQSVKLKLQKTTTEPVTVTPGTRSEHTIKKVSNLVDSYNDLLDLISHGPVGNKRSLRLKNELNHIVSSQMPALSECGITRADDMSLKLDTNALQDAENNLRLKDWLQEPDGFLASLTRKLDEITLNPMEYLDRTIVTYPNYSRIHFPNPYMTSAYSGMMFNYYC